MNSLMAHRYVQLAIEKATRVSLSHLSFVIFTKDLGKGSRVHIAILESTIVPHKPDTDKGFESHPDFHV